MTQVPSTKQATKDGGSQQFPLSLRKLSLLLESKWTTNTLLCLQLGVLSNLKKKKKRINLATKGIFYKNVQHAEAGHYQGWQLLIAGGRWHRLTTCETPPSSFCFALPRQGTPWRLITTVALLPCCRQLSLFLSNVTLCYVTMATPGHHSEECHRETGRGKNGSRAKPLPVTGNFWGGKRASSHFMEGETEEWTKALLPSGEWRSKPPNFRTTPCPALCSLVDMAVAQSFDKRASRHQTGWVLWYFVGKPRTP